MKLLSRLFLFLMLLTCVAGARATTVTVSSTTIPDLHYTGTTFTLRIWVEAGQNGFTDSAGIFHVSGVVDSSSVYKTVTCTLSGTTGICPSFTIDSTTDALDYPAARYNAYLYDSKGTKRDPWFVQFPVPATATSTTWAALRIYKLGQPKPNNPAYINRDETISLINIYAGTLNLADVGVLGRIETSVSPADPLHPIAVGKNDLATTSNDGVTRLAANGGTTAGTVVQGNDSRLAPATTTNRGTVTTTTSSSTVVSNDDPIVQSVEPYGSLAAAVSAIGSTPTVLNIPSVQTVSADLTIPSTLILRFVGPGTLSVASTKTVAIQSDGKGWPLKQIFSGSGVVRFSGNKSIPVYYPQWWGVVGGGTTDNSTALQAALDALPSDSIIEFTQGLNVGLASQITLTGRRNIYIKSQNRAANLGGGNHAGFTWLGSGGKMFYLDSCQGMTIDGFYFQIASAATLDKFIDIDGAGSGGTISTANSVIYNGFNGTQFNGVTPYLNQNFKAISISATSSSNNEHMNVSHNFIVGPGQIVAAADTGSISSGTNSLVVTGLSLTSANIGYRVRVGGAGSAGATLDTTITAVADSTHCTLAANASTAVSSARVHLGTGAGVGIYVGPSANALHQQIIDNTILYFAVGIDFTNGSGVVDDLQGGYSDINVRVAAGGAEGYYISNDRTEQSVQGLVVTSSPTAPIAIVNSRGQNASQLIEGWYVLDGVVYIEGQNWYLPPPTNGKLVSDRGSGNLRLSIQSANWSTSVPGTVTMALSGLTAIQASGRLVSATTFGISDATAFTVGASQYNVGHGASFGLKGETDFDAGQSGDHAGVRGVGGNMLGSPTVIVGVSGEIAAGTLNAGTDTIGVRSYFTTLGNHGGSGTTDYYGFKFVAPSAVGNPRNAFGLYLGSHPATGITGQRYGIYQAGESDVNFLAGPLQLSKTVTVSGTTGAQTINKTAGSVNFAAAASSLVVTNSLCSASSIVIATIATDDATATSVKAIAGSGSFTLKLNAAATAETRVNFIIIN
jgi:hypothetical protein